jgi:hypothetical protein
MWGRSRALDRRSDELKILIEKDLGSKTESLAKAMTLYNPDRT